jgi:hydroxymethylbilane synthase
VARHLRIATRGSALARWQAERVASLLGGDAELLIVDTAGDRDKTTSLDQLGGQGIFVKEVQAAVLEGRADLAVHSAKDLPSSAELAAPGLVLAAVPERADVRDALVGGTLDSMAPGATVATGSARRRALLADARPDLTFTDLRGNVPTRLEKVPGGAVVVAMAALDRLGLGDRMSQVLEAGVFVPQVAQGALAVECRVDDAEAHRALAAIEDLAARRAVDAERAWLAAIGGGCDLPVGAHARLDGDAMLLSAVLASGDGRVVLRDRERGHDAALIGRTLAERMLANGGRWLLDG